MSVNTKLDAKGLCTLCKKLSLPNEHVECCTCSGNFHVICSGLSKDDKLANKTTVTNFLSSSTKSNFLFLCDTCLTHFEISKADTDTRRINTLESKIESMDNQLNEIKNLIIANNTPPASANTQLVKTTHSDNNSIWFNKQKLATVKAPPSPAVLVVSKSDNLNDDKKHIDLVQKVIMDNDITLQDTYRNKDGDLTIVCDSKESRDNLKDFVQKY